LLCFAAAVLTFFMAGLLYLVRFERVDNLGAYSIPSEAGLLIPSDFVNYENGSLDRALKRSMIGRLRLLYGSY